MAVFRIEKTKDYISLQFISYFSSTQISLDKMAHVSQNKSLCKKQRDSVYSQLDMLISALLVCERDRRSVFPKGIPPG